MTSVAPFFENNTLDISIQGLKKHYSNNDFTPSQLVEYLMEVMDKVEKENPVWIYRLTKAELTPYLSALSNAKVEDKPLFGIPFAIKDNIDLANIPTTAACQEFAYTPTESAFVVDALIAAGAIPIGKTNLDQFATGLVGVRSPFGACKNALNEAFISGGSSAGSAVAVAAQWVSFSLGTDTAGSGRVPAALNNIVGLKPSKGLLSTNGVVPACRSIDCVSIFAHTADDANAVFNIAAQFDKSDAYARKNTYSNSKRYYAEHQGELCIGVPRQEQLAFFGDTQAQGLYEQALTALKQENIRCIEVDFAPFLEAAKLLYEGPWVAERYLATQPLIENNPNALLPVIQTIVGAGDKAKALDAFAAQYKLQACKQKADALWSEVDAILTPTHGPAYTIEQVEADPIQLNSNLGYYTNFMNLLDYSAVALPCAMRSNGLGFGVTVFAPAFTDKKLLGITARMQNIFKLSSGTGLAYKPQGIATQEGAKKLQAKTTVDVVVCGAHLSDLPLNWQLIERGGERVSVSKTSPHYQMYALAGGPPFRPGLVRDEKDGVSIDVEVWRLPLENFGSFVNEIPSPLGIGKVTLEDGRVLSGFVCEAAGLEGAENISRYGAWRAYISSK